MISANLRFEGFDADSWTNLISLFAPGVVDRVERDPNETDAPEALEHEEGKRTGTLLVITNDDGKPLSVQHSLRGRVRGVLDVSDLPELRTRFGANRVISMEKGVMEELAERLALRIEQGDDYITQWLMFMRGVRELMEEGRLRLSPNPIANFPIPAPSTVVRALDTLLPNGRALVCVAFKNGRPWTAFAVRRRDGDIDLVVGPDRIFEWTGPLGGDWTRDYRVISDAVARHVAPVHLGLFSQVSTLQSLMRNPDPGAWAKRVAIRDVIVHPTPPYLAVALSADVARAVAHSSSRVLGTMNIGNALSPVANFLRSRVAEVASVSSTLGFNPLSLLAALLERDEEDSA